MATSAKLVRGSVVGHLVGQTAPMIIGVAALMSIGLVDAYFIGQLGPDELAAIAFIFPIGVAVASLGVGLMVGINSVVSRTLGGGDEGKASDYANIGVAFSVATGMALGLLLYVLLDPLFLLMNADRELLPLIRDYMRPFALGLVLQMAIMGLNGVLRGQGEARKTSLVSVAYAATNWVLDPILITGMFGFEGFGIAGAAYASVIGWAVGVLLAYRLLKATALRLDLASIRSRPIAPPLKIITAVAGPAAFSNAINPIGLSVLTALAALEGQAAVAGFGAAGRVQSFAVVPLLALSGAIGAIVGQNWGARRFDRARKAAVYAFGFCIAFGLSVGAVLALNGHWFAQFFSDSEAVIGEFARYLEIAAWGYAAYGLLIVGNGILNAVGHAGWALAQSGARVFLVMLPVAWLGREAFGADAIYASELLANLAGGGLAVAIVWRLVGGRGRKASGTPATGVRPADTAPTT
jgi:putative MATE family efflux protein